LFVAPQHWRYICFTGPAQAWMAGVTNEREHQMSYEEIFGDVLLLELADLPAPAAPCEATPLSSIDGERYFTDVFSTNVL
jgi:hypothetical protein